MFRKRKSKEGKEKIAQTLRKNGYPNAIATKYGKWKICPKNKRHFKWL